MRSAIRFAFLAAIMGLSWQPVRAGSPAYFVEDLGVGPSSTAVYQAARINDWGQVVFTQGGKASRYTDGLGWQAVGPDGLWSVGQAINNHGQVLGFTFDGASVTSSFVTSDGAPPTILPLSGARPWGIGLNDAGQVVAMDSTGHFLIDPVTGLRPVPYFAGDINNAGQMAVGLKVGSQAHAGLYTEATGLLDLGGLEADGLMPLGLSNAGQMVGYLAYGPNEQYHAFMAGPDTGLVDLALVPSAGNPFRRAWDVNDAGQVVGDTSQPGSSEAVIFTSAGGIQNLNDLIDPLAGWNLLMATGINNRGQIVGLGDYQGRGHLFRLTPTAIPEPGTLALLAAGLVPLMRRKKT